MFCLEHMLLQCFCLIASWRLTRQLRHLTFRNMRAGIAVGGLASVFACARSVAFRSVLGTETHFVTKRFGFHMVLCEHVFCQYCMFFIGLFQFLSARDRRRSPSRLPGQQWLATRALLADEDVGSFPGEDLAGSVPQTVGPAQRLRVWPPPLPLRGLCGRRPKQTAKMLGNTRTQPSMGLPPFTPALRSKAGEGDVAKKYRNGRNGRRGLTVQELMHVAGCVRAVLIRQRAEAKPPSIAEVAGNMRFLQEALCNCWCGR